jgi:hypothetical protein
MGILLLICCFRKLEDFHPIDGPGTYKVASPLLVLLFDMSTYLEKYIRDLSKIALVQF